MPKQTSLKCIATETIECALRTAAAEFGHPDVSRNVSKLFQILDEVSAEAFISCLKNSGKVWKKDHKYFLL